MTNVQVRVHEGHGAIEVTVVMDGAATGVPVAELVERLRRHPIIALAAAREILTARVGAELAAMEGAKEGGQYD